METATAKRNTSYQTFRDFLQEELIRRCRKNPSYSLRAFATSAGVNHALLSMVLNGKRKVTVNFILKTGTALGLSEVKLQKFIRIAQKQNARATEPSFEEQRRQQELSRLTLDQYQLISEWYHDAILELARIPDFDLSAPAIAQALGISTLEAKSAKERLERMGLVEIDPLDGTWKETSNNTTIAHLDLTSPALRAFQKRVLQLSMDSLEKVPKEHRDHTCITMAVRSSDLEEAKKRIKKFRRELLAFLQREEADDTEELALGTYDDVYNVHISFFPLTNLHKKERP